MGRIEYCLGNVDARTRRQLRGRSDTREASCLEHCDRCHGGPFVVVDGAVHEDTSHEALLEVVDGGRESFDGGGPADGADERTPVDGGERA